MKQKNYKQNKVMKVNELMVGDWVNYRGICNRIAPADFCHFEWIDEIRPIPLTAEILEKNGFKEYDGLYRLDIAEGVFVNADFKSKEPFVSVHNTCYRVTPICKYLHQLQHTLRLCGIEKEIEL